MPAIFAANQSNVLVDGEVVDNVQSLAFRVVTEREDIRSVGTDERIAVSFGLRTVQGEIVVRSAADALDTHLQDRSEFQIVATLSKDGNEEPTTYAFDTCFVEGKEFSIGAGGTALTTYVFTATRVRKE